jgi:DNA gyrase subunit A
MQRPDLTNIDPEIVAYIEYLEKKAGMRLARGAFEQEAAELSPERASEPLPAERESPFTIITAGSSSQGSITKRTYRHLYTRQHRGGMGVFGIDIDLPDQPLFLAVAEDKQNLLFFTNHARVFRQQASLIPSKPLFAKGEIISERMIGLEPDEKLIAILPEQARGYVALASESGRVRALRHHLFGEHMRPGMALYSYREFGPLASVCWTPGDAELFLVTRQGIGIRFSEKSLSPSAQGDQGIKLTGDDRVAAIAPVYPDSGVFILGADGRGTIRQMSGFAPNKSPGGSGKIAFKSNHVVGAAAIEANDDLFILSRLGKVIRFPADEVPPTENVVQGVNCMGLRGDEAIAVLKSGPIY